MSLRPVRRTKKIDRVVFTFFIDWLKGDCK